MPMRKILDINILRDEAVLRPYLEGGNIGVFSNYAFIEMTKGNAWSNMAASFRIAKDYSSQILVLKETAEIISKTHDVADVEPNSLIDSKATSSFPGWVKRFADPDSAAAKDKAFLSLAQDTVTFYATISAHAELIKAAILSLKEDVPQLASAKFEINAELPVEMHHSVLHKAFLETKGYFDSQCIRISNLRSLKYSWVFRFCLAGIILSYFFASRSGTETMLTSKLENDVTDCTYVAFGSYFDGVLSKEKKLPFVYTNTMKLLSTL